MGDITKDEVEKLYLVDLLTDSEIAQRLGTYQAKISRLRKKWGIPTLDKTGRIAARLPDVTEEQYHVLFGSLLGDGWVSATSKEAARFCETHSEDQKPYLEWKAEVLQPFTSTIYPTSKVVGSKTYTGWGMTTQSCLQLRHLYDLFYPPPARVRKFPKVLTKGITPLSLAVWYLDDGSLHSGHHPQITFGLDDQSLRYALKGLRHLGFSPTILENPDGTVTICFPGQDMQFFELIGGYVPDCMSYKIPEPSDRKLSYEKGRELTPDTARTLYDGGMSCTAIADLYDVSSSTVHRRIHKEGSPTRMGRPRSSYSRRAAKVSLENYDSSLWKHLPEGEQGQWVEEIYSILVKTPFPFPKPLSDVGVRFQKLEDKEVFLTEESEIRPRTLFGVRLCDSYFPNRFKARYRDQMSAYEAWFDPKLLRRAIQIQLKGGDPVIPYRVRKAIQYQVRTPTIFRPGVAKYIYQTYAKPGDKVWDPCAGYGGRMLAALASGVHYIGTDIEPETVEGNQKLASNLGLEAELYCHPAETFKVPDDVSLVFTSPPYFDREKYSDKKGQSWKKYGDSAAEWVDSFLKPVIREAYRSLVAGGTFALNINDLRDRRGDVTPLVDMTIEAAISAGFQHLHTLKMPLSNLSPRDHEPVLIFRKV